MRKERGTTFLGVILCGMILSLLVLFFWQGLNMAGQIHRNSSQHTRAILAASVLMEEIREAEQYVEGEVFHPGLADPLVLVSRVEKLLAGLYRIQVLVLAEGGRELLAFETLAIQPGGDPD